MRMDIETLRRTELQQVSGGVGGLPDEPTIQDLIDLAQEIEEINEWRNQKTTKPPVY